MFIRSSVQPDLGRLTELTIETFGPFYEDSFRPLVGETIFANQHGNWRDDYRKQVAELHDPTQHKYVAVAEVPGAVAGYVAWSIDPERRNGSIVILAVAADHRRGNVGTALCEHAFRWRLSTPRVTACSIACCTRDGSLDAPTSSSMRAIVVVGTLSCISRWSSGSGA